MAEMTQFRQEISASEKGNVAAIGEISTALEIALAQEREKAEQERAKLADEIVSLITNMVEGQQARWSSTVDGARTDLAASQSRVQGGYQVVSKGLDTWAEREGIFSKTMLSNKEEVKKSIVDAAKVCFWRMLLTEIADQRGSTIQESARRVHAQTIELVDTQMTALDEKTQALDDFVIKGLLLYTLLIVARGHVATRYQHHGECLAEVVDTFRNSVTSLQGNVAQTRKSITHNSNAFATNTTARSSAVHDFDSKSSEVVRALKKKVIKHDLLEDIPTSETPKKRDYQIPSAWSLTKPHEEILGHMNKMPLGKVDINLTTQTPASMSSRAQSVVTEYTGPLEHSFERKLVTPLFEKGAVVEKITPEGRENTVFKSKLAAPSTKRRAMGSH
jgi:kinesin family member 11